MCADMKPREPYDTTLDPLTLSPLQNSIENSLIHEQAGLEPEEQPEEQKFEAGAVKSSSIAQKEPAEQFMLQATGALQENSGNIQHSIEHEIMYERKKTLKMKSNQNSAEQKVRRSPKVKEINLIAMLRAKLNDEDEEDESADLFM